MKTPGPLLLLLVGCLGLLPLDHAAPHDAVKAPQVEEGDGAEQSHGDDLCGPDQTRAGKVQLLWLRLVLLASTCWRPSVMEVTGDIPQVTAESMYPSGPTELLKFPCCSQTHWLALTLTAHTSATPPTHHCVPNYHFGHLVRLANPRSLRDQSGLQRLRMRKTKENLSRSRQDGWIEGRTVWKPCVPLSYFPRLILEYRYQEGRQQSHRCCMALSRVEHKHSCFIAAT